MPTFSSSIRSSSNGFGSGLSNRTTIIGSSSAATNGMAALRRNGRGICVTTTIPSKAADTSTTPITPAPVVFHTVGVVGLGLMGHGIAQVAAQSLLTSGQQDSNNKNNKIVAYEAEQKYLDAGRARIETSIQKLVLKGKMSEADADEILHHRIIFTTDVQQLADVDFCVEAVIENMSLKRDLYTKLGAVCKPTTIFASNTSSLSIAEMAQFSQRPDRFVGVHFFNPVQLMKLVEVIRTDETCATVVDQVYAWVQSIGKTPVRCGDTPGFIVNRLLVPALMQAMALAARGDASVADIDVSMVLGAGHPMGPLHLADYIGLDTCLYIVQGWVDKYPHEPSFFIPSNLQTLVDAGHLGRKTGRGFYHWNGDKRGDPAV